MIINIHSAESLVELARKPFPPKTALISITDYVNEPIEISYEPDYILRLSFEDISVEDLSEEELFKANKDKRLFTVEQAEKIAEFILPIKDEIELLICQCEYGVSRSSGCAAAIIEYFYGNGIDIFADIKYTPNKLVYHRTIDALKKHGRQV
jgi:predicted protein tyrosine phosphatase